MLKNLIIIGGGPAGNAAALTAAAAGCDAILLVEKDAMGGTCTNRGCIPTKFLLSRSEISGGSPGEWEKLLAHKKGLVQGLSRSIESRCLKEKIEVVKGRGRLIGPTEVAVDLADGGTKIFKAGKVILATGSVPAQLPNSRSDGTTVIGSDEALELADLPKTMVIVGSGPVGAEFAQIFTRFGVIVSLIEAFDRIFPMEDREVHELFMKKYRQMGVDVRLGDPVAAIDVQGGRAVVKLKSGVVVEADRALIGIGRRLKTDELGLENVGISVGPRGEIPVDAELRTSQPTIYAAGDITGRMLLAHVASCQGEFAARRALGLPHPEIPYRSISWATFTKPEIASVGVTSESATRQGIEHRFAVVPLMENVKARIDRTTEGFVKIVVDNNEGRVIGGTVVGPQASDIVHILALAIHQRMTMGDLAGFCFNHPSVAEIIQDVIIKLKRNKYNKMHYA